SDDKAMVSIFVTNLLRLRAEHYVPDRDIILALTADEEGGGSNGVRWLLANHRDLIDAEFAINEGGGGALRDGKPFINSIGAAEKVSTNFTVSTANRGGHSSVPRDDNAIYQLAAALTRIGAHQFPVMLNEVTRAYFTRTAAIETPEVGAAMRAIVANPNDAAASAVLSHDLRGDDADRRPRAERAAPGGERERELPDGARPRSGRRACRTRRRDRRHRRPCFRRAGDGARGALTAHA